MQRFVITVLKTFTKPSAQHNDFIPNHIPVGLQIGSKEVDRSPNLKAYLFDLPCSRIILLKYFSPPSLEMVGKTDGAETLAISIYVL